MKRHAFTLIELLIALAIIAIVVALLVVAIQAARESAKTAECGNRLKQLALGCHSCQTTHKRMPPGADWFPDRSIRGGAGIGPLFFHLLPFLEQDSLYQSSRHQSAAPGMDYFDYQQVADRQLALFNCPADPTLPTAGGAAGVKPYAASSYAANFVVFGQVDKDYRYVNAQGRPSLGQSFPDGTSNTILLAEKYALAGSGGCHWGYWGQPTFTAFFALSIPGQTDGAVGPTGPDDPRDSRFQVRPAQASANPALCSSAHRGMNVAMADASVRNLAAGMDRFIWWAFVTPAGAEAAGGE